MWCSSIHAGQHAICVLYNEDSSAHLAYDELPSLQMDFRSNASHGHWQTRCSRRASPLRDQQVQTASFAHCLKKNTLGYSRKNKPRHGILQPRQCKEQQMDGMQSVVSWSRTYRVCPFRGRLHCLHRISGRFPKFPLRTCPHTSLPTFTAATAAFLLA